MSATALKVSPSFNATAPKLKVKVTSNDLDQYQSALKRFHRAGQWGAHDINRIIGQVLAPYYEAVDKKTDFKGKDPLEAIGLDGWLKGFLSRGIPQESLDELMINMVDTGSLAGVKICKDAGADPTAFHQFHGRSALDTAETHGRADMAEAMGYKVTPKPVIAAIPSI